MNALHDLLSKSQLALELDASIAELDLHDKVIARKNELLQAQAAEIERLRGLLSETLDTLSDMTTDEFSNGADGFIRRKIATELGRTEQP